MRADERLRDVVHAEAEREVEIGEVLLGQRRDRERHAGDVHTLVRLDQPARDDLAVRSGAVDALHAQPDVTVVDEDLVAGFEHRPEHVGRDREVVGAAGVLSRDHDLLAALEEGGSVELADPDLRALQVGDQRERAPDRCLHGAHAARAPLVLVVRPVGEVEPNSVHARVDERSERLLVVRRGADGGDDLRAAVGRLHQRRLLAPAERGPTRIHRFVTELLLDPQELVVLRHAIGARRVPRS